MKTNNKYETLKKRLLEKMREKNLSIAALERKAGLKVHAIRNFTLGRSKKPNIENLQAVVKVLGCSMEELFSDQKEKIKSEDIFLQDFGTDEILFVKNIGLFREIVDFVLKTYTVKSHIPSMKQILFSLKEIYMFCDKNQYNKLDEKFADWIITKCINANELS